MFSVQPSRENDVTFVGDLDESWKVRRLASKVVKMR